MTDAAKMLEEQIAEAAREMCNDEKCKTLRDLRGDKAYLEAKNELLEAALESALKSLSLWKDLQRKQGADYAAIVETLKKMGGGDERR